MSAPTGLVVYEALFERAPITLTGGMADSFASGVFSLMGIGNLLGSLVADAGLFTFQPLPGSSLVRNQFGEYPYANMAVAANATIAQPLTLSMLMRYPVNTPGGHWVKLAVMTGLKNTLKRHCMAGGTFAVATPTLFWTDVLLADLHDVSSGETNQAQFAWRWDFIKPLVSLQDAAYTMDALMTSISVGTPTTDTIGSGGIMPDGTSSGSFISTPTVAPDFMNS